MDRRKLRKLSETRLQDAKVLISCRRFSAAYYVTGYSVECALKACIAKQTRRFEFPDKKRITDSYTHNLVKLVELAGLKPALELKTKADAAFATNWAW